MQSKFIVIEGLDGSGKATQTKLLYEALKERYTTIKLSFPDYHSDSSALVKMYLDGKISKNIDEINTYASSTFYSADRYISFFSKWKNNYMQGDLILTDRYTTSNQIYQSAKLPKEQWSSFVSWIEDFEYNKLGLPKPDLVIYLNMPVDISQKLMLQRYKGEEEKKDLHEANINFLKSCHVSAQFCIQNFNWKVVNCFDGKNIRSIEDIHGEVLNIVDDFLKNRG